LDQIGSTERFANYLAPMKHIGVLAFGHGSPPPHSPTRTVADALVQSIEPAVAAEALIAPVPAR